MSPVLALSTENASKPNDNLSRSLGDVLSDRPYSIGLGFCHFAKPLPLQKKLQLLLYETSSSLVRRYTL